VVTYTQLGKSIVAYINGAPKTIPIGLLKKQQHVNCTKKNLTSNEIIQNQYMHKSFVPLRLEANSTYEGKKE